MMRVGSAELTELELEVIDYFISFVTVLGLPRSIGQIYGLLFIENQPVPMDFVVRRLGLSKGSVSQGLSLLKSLGAVVPVEKKEDRREHFVADLQVSRIVSHFISERLNPRLRNGEKRLEVIRELALRERGPEPGCLQRIDALQKWHSRASKSLPLIEKLVSFKRGKMPSIESDQLEDRY